MKYAVLDTDFVSKTHAARVDGQNHLIDRVLEMPDYAFFCHAQTVEELSRHHSDAPQWLAKKLRDGTIEEYTDKRIIEEMTGLYKGLAVHQYTTMLRTACDAFDGRYFADNYAGLDSRLSAEEYLSQLAEMETRIERGKNLGEIKAYVLLQWLSVLYGNQIFYFCSDDKAARDGVLALTGISSIQCITLVSAFARLHVESSYGWTDIAPYIQATLAYYRRNRQETIRVFEASDDGKMIKVPCGQVLREIYEDKFLELKNGFLKYKAEK